MGEIIRLGLMVIGAAVVLLMAMFTFLVICALFAPKPRIHRDLFAENELRKLRASRGASNTPKVTRVAGGYEVNRRGQMVPRIPPAQDMMDYLKGGRP